MQKVVDALDIPMEDRDTKGDVYEYMLGKMRLPARTVSSVHRPIIKFMKRDRQPHRHDLRPGFRHLRFPCCRQRLHPRTPPEALTDPSLREHFHTGLFSGFDFDNTMPNRVDEHAAPRCREPQDRIPRLPRRGLEHDAEAFSVILGTRRLRVARLRRHRQRPPRHGPHQENRTASGPVPD